MIRWRDFDFSTSVGLFILALAASGCEAVLGIKDVSLDPTGGGGAGGGSSVSTSAGGAVCGDGLINNAEDCDGSDLGGATCASVKGTGYFAPPGQALTCKPDCTIDTSACTNACILDVPGSQLDSCVVQ